MMFELKHSRVSVIFYQVHVILKFSKTAALFSERPLKNEIVLWEDFLSYFLLHKKLASNLTHDIFVLLCKIIFFDSFLCFYSFFQKNYFTYQHFWEDDYKSWGLFSKLEALSSLSFRVLFCVWSSQQLCIEGPLPVSNSFEYVSPTSMFENKIELEL